MPLLDSYAIWNNKGGVGKSTITFHISSKYAEENPDKNVLVIDMCPQSNSSMMLLGGGSSGEEKVLTQCIQEPIPKTVVGYLSKVLSGGRGAPLPNPYDFTVRVNEHNEYMPENLYLLCGDGNLEPMVPAINDAAAAKSLTPTDNPWIWVHETILNFIKEIAKGDKDWVFFIDTNPSFSIYTEIAISSVEKLIIPVNADDSSRVAIKALFTLLHGTAPPHPIYGTWTFAEQAKSYKINLPKIHLIIGNRLTQYEGPASAFGALSDATADSMYNEFKINPDRFTVKGSKIKTLKEFRNKYSVALRDFNTAGVVAAHVGHPMSKMKEKKYPVYNTATLVQKRYIKNCIDALNDVIKTL